METWERAEVPSLAPFGPAPHVRLHDSATGKLVELDGSQEAGLYVCGITPYDATHLGHANTYVAFDLLLRAWLDAGRGVHYVQNVTDVDDPLLERADRDGVDWRELAAAEIARFADDMVALRVIPPRSYVGAVESIDLVVAFIERLRGAGHAYQVEDDWYFEVHADPTFGSVSGLDVCAMDALFAERGGDPERAGKRHRLDCLLWRAERPGEPAWDTSLGRGRPGWHIECCAIAREHLSADFEVQGGGSDLVFPHHEMSAAEAHAGFPGTRFAQVYSHAGMVAYQGEKMSKSRGNLVFVSRMRADGVDPAALRLALMAHHYRSDWEWTDADLAAATQRLATYRAALPATTLTAATDLVHAVRGALAADLDAPKALALLDAWASGTAAGSVASGTAAGSAASGTAAGSAESGTAAGSAASGTAADHPGSGEQAVRDLLDARLGLLL